MSKVIVTPILIGALLFSAAASAYDVLINVTGDISASTCDIDSSTVDFEVNLGDVATKSFPAPGATSSDKRFSILLRNCTAAASGVKVGFFGTQDDVNPELLKLTDGGAKGLGVSILDDMKKSIPINMKSKSYPLTPSVDNELVFYGRYMSSSSIVTAGRAEAIATFMLEYD